MKRQITELLDKIKFKKEKVAIYELNLLEEKYILNVLKQREKIVARVAEKSGIISVKTELLFLRNLINAFNKVIRDE